MIKISKSKTVSNFQFEVNTTDNIPATFTVSAETEELAVKKLIENLEYAVRQIRGSKK
jgi:hypothetical protein